MSKINLGCGDVKMPGFINADIRPEVKPDMCIDISELSQFKDGEFTYMLAHDVLEHFPHAQVWTVLANWIRCLAVGGRLEIQVPSIDRIYADRKNLIERYGGDSSGRFSKLIFGGQSYPANFHFVCFTPEFFQLVAKKFGLKIESYSPVGLYNHKVIFLRLK